MTSQVRTVQCSSPGCTRTFPTSTRNPVHYCEACRRERRRQTHRRFDRCKRIREFDLVEDPREELNGKLDSAEFSVYYDAGPEDCAFRPGAKLGAWEVHYMLKYKTIAEDSILIHNRTQQRHRVVCAARGRLVLDPPWHLTDEAALATDGEIEQI